MAWTLDGLKKHFQKRYDDETLTKILDLVQRRLDPNSFESVKRWVAQCYNEPRIPERIMEALNEVMGGHGVEALRESGGDSADDQVATYVNTGDTYRATVVLSPNGVFYLTSWGDYLESLADSEEN